MKTIKEYRIRYVIGKDSRVFNDLKSARKEFKKAEKKGDRIPIWILVIDARTGSLIKLM